jgi:hypothetical protein
MDFTHYTNCLELYQMDNMCRLHFQFDIHACGQHTQLNLSLCHQGSLICTYPVLIKCYFNNPK